MFLLLVLFLLKLEPKTSQEATKEMESSEKSILFITHNLSSIDFAKEAFNKYNGQIKFILSPPEEVPKTFYIANPTIIPFHRTKPVKIEQPPHDSKSFVYWVERVINETHYNVVLPQQLKSILTGPIPALFQIDSPSKPPENVPNNITLFLSNSKLFSQFNIDIKEGYYVFRPQDQQFIPYNGSYFQQIYSPLTNINDVKNDESRLTLGFVVEKYGNQTKSQSEILSNLYEIYGEKYLYLFLFNDENSLIAKNAPEMSLPTPFFLILNISSHPHVRWVLSENIDSLDHITKFINSVENKEISPTIVSEPEVPFDPNENLHKLVSTTFEEYVYDDSYEAVVIFLNEELVGFRRYAVLALTSVLKFEYLRIFYIDVSKNDLPLNVPQIYNYPGIIVWPAGKKDEPIIFKNDNFDLIKNDILDFIFNCISKKFKPKEKYIDSVKKMFAKQLSAFQKLYWDDDEKSLEI